MSAKSGQAQDDGGYPIAEYAFLPGLDRPLAVSRGGSVFFFALDPVSGSVDGLLRTSDRGTWAMYRYTPYGQLEAGSFDYQTPENPLRFAAREFDSETALYYFRARYYDPERGRFISEDPIGLAGGTNLYSYAGGDPVNHGDPTGTKCTDWYYVRQELESGAIVGVIGYAYTICDGSDAVANGGGSGSGTDGNAVEGVEPSRVPCNNFVRAECTRVWNSINRGLNSEDGACRTYAQQAKFQMNSGQLRRFYGTFPSIDPRIRGMYVQNKVYLFDRAFISDSFLFMTIIHEEWHALTARGDEYGGQELAEYAGLQCWFASGK